MYFTYWCIELSWQDEEWVDNTIMRIHDYIQLILSAHTCVKGQGWTWPCMSSNTSYIMSGHRARDSMSKVGGLYVHEVGGYYFHSEYIWHRLLVFFMTTSNFGGAQPPLIKKWGGSSPPCPPPRFSAPGTGSCTCR